MPYIPSEDRPFYNEVILGVLDLIVPQNDLLRRMEYVAYFAYEVFQGFLGNLTRPTDFSGSAKFDKKDRADLNALADRAIAHLLRDGTDLMVQAGELNYLVSGVAWGAIGDDARLPSAKYAQRSFLRSAMKRIQPTLPPSTSRQSVMADGVLDDIIDEMYRRKTAAYEDEKIVANGDVWPLIA